MFSQFGAPTSTWRVARVSGMGNDSSGDEILGWAKRRNEGLIFSSYGKLELGSLTEQRPIGKHPIKPWLADEFPQLFPEWDCEVVALEIERSFWEKATILHAEHHRPDDKPTPDRYSRHYADTAALAKHADGQRAVTLSDVRQKVVDWKARFFGSKWARYDLAVPGSFRLVPAEYRVDALRRDYQAMRDMYLTEPPSFDEIMTQLGELETQINVEGDNE